MCHGKKTRRTLPCQRPCLNGVDHEDGGVKGPYVGDTVTCKPKFDNTFLKTPEIAKALSLAAMPDTNYRIRIGTGEFELVQEGGSTYAYNVIEGVTEQLLQSRLQKPDCYDYIGNILTQLQAERVGKVNKVNRDTFTVNLRGYAPSPLFRFDDLFITWNFAPYVTHIEYIGSSELESPGVNGDDYEVCYSDALSSADPNPASSSTAMVSFSLAAATHAATPAPPPTILIPSSTPTLSLVDECEDLCKVSEQSAKKQRLDSFLHTLGNLLDDAPDQEQLAALPSSVFKLSVPESTPLSNLTKLLSEYKEAEREKKAMDGTLREILPQALADFAISSAEDELSSAIQIFKDSLERSKDLSQRTASLQAALKEYKDSSADGP